MKSGFSTLLAALLLTAAGATAQNVSTFTYQGLLTDNAGPANGRYDLQFTLYGDAAGGSGVGGPVVAAPLGVTNGLFSVQLNFGSAAFTGAERWLQIGIRTNGSVGAYTALTPRQAVTPTPYAITAANVAQGAGLSGAYTNPVALSNSSNQIAGSFTGNGAAVTNVNAATLDELSASAFWQVGGNHLPASRPIGSLNNQPLELIVNGVRALRIEPTTNYMDGSGTFYFNAVNLVGGTPANYIAPGVHGSVIGGGGMEHLDYLNSLAADFSYLGGGVTNSIQAQAAYSFLGGGTANLLWGERSFLGGGAVNCVKAGESFLGCGSDNVIQSGAAASFLGGGEQNSILPNASHSFIGGGAGNSIEADAFMSFLGGGIGNAVGSADSFLGGGSMNTIYANARNACLGGGEGNTVSDGHAFLGGGRQNSIGTNASHSFLGGGAQNSILPQASYSFVGGGSGNRIGSSSSFLGGGSYNSNGSPHSVLGGGFANTIQMSADYSVLGGGYDNWSIGAYSTVVGGRNNLASTYSFAAGTHAWALYQGDFVWADSQDSIFSATGDNQFLIRAAGGVGINKNNPSAGLDVNGEIHWGTANQLTTNQTGSIELGDSTGSGTRPYIDFHYGTGNFQDYNTRIMSDASQQISILRSGSSTPMARFNSSGLTVNGTFVSSSDRNAKEDFQPVCTREVLEKVAALPITRWNYKEDKDSKHLGPMAQDFFAAFSIGPDDKHITTVDEAGVALAAIQGLNQKLTEELKRRDGESAELRSRLEQLEHILNAKHGGNK